MIDYDSGWRRNKRGGLFNIYDKDILKSAKTRMAIRKNSRDGETILRAPSNTQHSTGYSEDVQKSFKDKGISEDVKVIKGLVSKCENKAIKKLYEKALTDNYEIEIRHDEKGKFKYIGSKIDSIIFPHIVENGQINEANLQTATHEIAHLMTFKYGACNYFVKHNKKLDRIIGKIKMSEEETKLLQSQTKKWNDYVKETKHCKNEYGKRIATEYIDKREKDGLSFDEAIKEYLEFTQENEWIKTYGEYISGDFHSTNKGLSMFNNLYFELNLGMNKDWYYSVHNSVSKEQCKLEAIADYCSLSICNQKLYNLFRSYQPEVASIFDEILEVIAR